MPWMLLRGAWSSHAEVAASASATNGAASWSDRHDAWVLIGGLEQALVQAGMVTGLLEAHERPRHIFAAGMSVVNALLAASGDAKTFARGWEALREKRFLWNSALSANRLLGIANGRLNNLVEVLADVVSTATDTRRASAPCYVAAEDGFILLPAEPGDGAWRALVRQTLRFAAAPPPLLAAAIREAGAISERVVVVGVERTNLTHPDVEVAIRSTTRSPTSVSCLVAPTPRPPGLLQYLLPGSGAPERLYRDGRGSALRWLQGGAEPSGNGRHQAPRGEASSAEGGGADFPDV